MSWTIVWAMLLAECVIRSFENPDIKAIGPKSWMFGYTVHLHLWFLVLYLLPNLADFRTANALVSRWHRLAHSTFAPYCNKRKNNSHNKQAFNKITQLLSFKGETIISMRMNHKLKQLPVCVSKSIRLAFTVFLVRFRLNISPNSAWFKSIGTRSDILASFWRLASITAVQITLIWIVSIR